MNYWEGTKNAVILLPIFGIHLNQCIFYIYFSMPNMVNEHFFIENECFNLFSHIHLFLRSIYDNLKGVTFRFHLCSFLKRKQ